MVFTLMVLRKVVEIQPIECNLVVNLRDRLPFNRSLRFYYQGRGVLYVNWIRTASKTTCPTSLRTFFMVFFSYIKILVT